MTHEQYLKNLAVPAGPIDVVLDTDAYNEIDDQFAISYLIGKAKDFRIRAICAAPFSNSKAATAAEGMEKSYDEILKLLRLMGREELKEKVIRGSQRYLPDEQTAVASPAAQCMAQLAQEYSPQRPLYIIAIGAITNVASAILQNPHVAENCVVVWLGGHGLHMPQGASEFNMKQDIAAARVVYGSGVPLVLLPCAGVVDRLCTSRYELQHWLAGKSALCDYLYENTVREAESYAAGKPWTRVIWDVSAVAWLLNADGRLMKDKVISCPVPEYDRTYTPGAEDARPIRYVCWIDRDAVFEDLFDPLSGM